MNLVIQAKPEKLEQEKPMEKWDQRFCELAEYVSAWSKDKDAQVGAVVVSKRGGDVTIGFNGLPMGVDDSDERLGNNKIKLEMIVHAEVNAILAAGLRAQGSVIYVWGKPVCSHCAGAIIQAGVKRVVAIDPKSISLESKWRKTGELAVEMFNESGVEVDFYTKGPEESSTPS